MNHEAKQASVCRTRYLIAALVIVAGPIGTFITIWPAMWIASAAGMHREEVPWVGFQVVLVGILASLVGLVTGVVIAVRTFRARTRQSQDIFSRYQSM